MDAAAIAVAAQAQMNKLYPPAQRAALVVKTSTGTDSDGDGAKNVASIAMSKELYHIIANTQAATKADLEITSDSSDARLLNGARDVRYGAGAAPGQRDKQNVSDP